MQAAVGGGHPAVPAGTPGVTRGGGGTRDRDSSMLLPSLVPACGHSGACNAFIFFGGGECVNLKQCPFSVGHPKALKQGPQYRLPWEGIAGLACVPVTLSPSSWSGLQSPGTCCPYIGKLRPRSSVGLQPHIGVSEGFCPA